MAEAENPFTRIEYRLNQLDQLIQSVLIPFINNSGPSGTNNKPLTIDGAASFLESAKSTIYGLVSKRKIPHYKRDGKLYFLEEELLEWIKEGKQKTQSEIKTGISTFSRANNSRPVASA